MRIFSRHGRQMKILLTFSIILTIIFSSMFAFAFFPNPEIEIENEITVQAPASVIYNRLSNYSVYANWSPMIHEIRTSGTSDAYVTTYRFGEKSITIRETVHFSDELNVIYIQQTDGRPGAFLGSITNKITINSLSDGTTVVMWKFRYRLFSIGSILLNPFYIRPEIQRTLESNANALREFLEH